MPMQVVVKRHCVAQGENGLSPLQQALIQAPERIRIAAAPTGAGKSYAFQRAMQEGQRVLFIVPTRRLAQNLAAGLIQDLIAAGWSEDQADRRVAVWSSEQTEALKTAGETRISGVRLRQMAALVLGSSRGEMIIAIPEVVSGLLIRRRVETGQAGKGIFDLLDDFDHIVFDECHTIEARGFGLAAAMARLIAADHGLAKLSFMSATPLDIASTLTETGVPAEAIGHLQERIVSEGRPLHGDVRLVLHEHDSLYTLIREQLPAIAAELAAGRQVVIIYNRLFDLEKDLPGLARELPAAGIAAERVLVINSIRDSLAEGLHEAGFAMGRRQDPRAFDLLIATASVEIGVTFRQADFMLMEPGFAPLNFLQRYGRAARRGADGVVHVRLDTAEQRRNPWLRRLKEWVVAQAGEQVSIEALTEVLAQETVADFAHDQNAVFGQLAKQALWCSGLYWLVLMDHLSNRGPRWQHLRAVQPQAAKTVYGLEQTVRRITEIDPDCQPEVEYWLKLFRAQAFDLRSIEPRIRVILVDGQAVQMPRVWLQRETTVFERCAGSDEEIRLQAPLDEYFREERDYEAKRLWCCYFPHSAEVRVLPMDHQLIEAWCKAIADVDPYGFDWDDAPEALEAARKLVRLTGLVPGHDPQISVEAVHAIL